jgi:hypothetical protein
MAPYIQPVLQKIDYRGLGFNGTISPSHAEYWIVPTTWRSIRYSRNWGAIEGRAAAPIEYGIQYPYWQSPTQLRFRGSSHTVVVFLIYYRKNEWMERSGRMWCDKWCDLSWGWTSPQRLEENIGKQRSHNFAKYLRKTSTALPHSK